MLADVVYLLDEEQPQLGEAMSRLECVAAKYADHENKRAKFMKMLKPVLNRDIFYQLPRRLLDGRAKKFPLANIGADVVSVSSQSQSARSAHT